jgi:hypothetical protein
MADAGKNGLNASSCLDQIDRLTSSTFLHGSEAHCRLIRFLADHSLRSPSEPVKEYQIATEVLGRPAGFDPISDASARVQVARLRAKLIEYYSSVGSKDPILVEIPKGRYELSFRRRPVLPEDPPSAETISGPTPPIPETPAPRHRLRIVAIAILPFLAGILLTTGILIPLLRLKRVISDNVPTSQVTRPQTALEIFWGPFVHAPEEPFVVFRNRTLFGNLDSGMRRFDSSRDNLNQVVQRYTGVGEVMGMLELTRLFDRFGGEFRVKRESLFTIDDARDNNLIFVGSPDEALDLSEIPGTTEFTVNRLETKPQTKLAIIDKHPGSGRATIYARSFGVNRTETDYALVALKRGLDQTHWILFLEGTSSVATQAAVDFACSNLSVTNLLNQLHFTSSASLKPFEGLLRVRVAHDVPVETELLTLRETKE